MRRNKVRGEARKRDILKPTQVVISRESEQQVVYRFLRLLRSVAASHGAPAAWDSSPFAFTRRWLLVHFDCIFFSFISLHIVSSLVISFLSAGFSHSLPFSYSLSPCRSPFSFSTFSWRNCNLHIFPVFFILFIFLLSFVLFVTFPSSFLPLPFFDSLYFPLSPLSSVSLSFLTFVPYTWNALFVTSSDSFTSHSYSFPFLLPLYLLSPFLSNIHF